MEEGKKKLTPKQKKIAKAAPPEDEITGDDFAALRKDEVKHDCANHVKENATGREGFPINHTLLEDGTVTHYTVEFNDEIVENIPVEQLTILEMNEHKHSPKRDDYKHGKKPRREHMESAAKLSDKEWYQKQLNEALMKKFRIKK